MVEKKDEFIERNIVTGLIVSTEYVREIHKIWNTEYLESSTARLLASWCIEHFEAYNQAPGKDIEGIYTQKLKDGSVQQEDADSIERILSGLSEEYSREHFNVPYLIDQTKLHFQEQKIKKFVKDVRTELLSGSITEAERLACSYLPIVSEDYKSINPFKVSAERVKKAFEDREKPLIEFPTNKPEMKALGEFWNEQFTRDSFVAIMGSEKKGKTFMMMEIAMRGMSSGCHVALFQAGDMTEDQQLMRFWIYLAKKSNKKKYCVGMWLPELDCKLNQFDNCPNPDFREKEHKSIFKGVENVDKEISENFLIKCFQENPNYKACCGCKSFQGTVWLKRQESVNPLTWKEAYKGAHHWQHEHRKEFKLCTYSNETLSIMEIKSLLGLWERSEGFVPDVIIVDYADILASDPDCKRLDFRHQQNKIWQRLRALSQDRHCCVVTATQAAASSYGKYSLKETDFSETKTKYAHVTAIYGLNQKPEEKKIGLMRLNAIMVRDEGFVISDHITILQRLQIGRPFLGSYK